MKPPTKFENMRRFPPSLATGRTEPHGMNGAQGLLMGLSAHERFYSCSLAVRAALSAMPVTQRLRKGAMA